MPFPARNYSLLMPLLRGRSHFCKHALRQAAIPLPSVSDDDKRVHAVIKASFEQALRSEEHTSELQSLMRISYAVFCLKKKKTSTNNKTKKSSTTTTMLKAVSNYN